MWERSHRPESYGEIWKVLTIDGFITLKLTGEPTLNYSGAGFYGVAYNLRQQRFEIDLLGEIGIDPGLMPELHRCEEIVGREDAIAFNEPDWIMLRSRNWKYIRYDSTGGEVLYDLLEDPHEVINRAADLAYVDLLHEARLRTLSRALQASRSRCVSRCRTKI